MALHLVLLTAILAFSLASTEQCVSSPGSTTDFSLRSHKNASGDWTITVDTRRRMTTEEDPREISVNVHHETKICGKKEIEQHVSVTFLYPSLHDTSKSGATTATHCTSTAMASTSTTTTATPSISTTTTTTPPATTTTTSTTTTPPATKTTTSTTTTPPATTTTTSTTTTPPATTTTTSTTTPNPCPHSGYQLYPELNCYKAFRSYQKTWSEAREQCKRDGGDLMVMESERERTDVFIPLFEGWNGWLWVGVYVPRGGNRWTTVKGQPALRTWWRDGYPREDTTRKCALAHSSTGHMGNGICAHAYHFICEISL